MYNLIEYSSNYSKTAGFLWLYSKDEATNFNADDSNTISFKSFIFNAKLLGDLNQANGILKNTKVAFPLKYLIKNFWRSLKMLLINCKIVLKLKWTKYCVLSANSNDNDNDNNITFSIKDTKLNVTVVTLSARDNKKLSTLLSRGFDISFSWNEYKTKIENKNTTNRYRYFFASNFIEVDRLFALVYSNQDNDPKRLKTRRYYLPK